MNDSEIGQAAEEVEAAWQTLRKQRTPLAMAAYNEAFAVWRALALRPVGRPPSGDAAALGSAERAQALRTRHQESAEKWGRVSPHLQALRRAIAADDSDAIIEATIELVNTTGVTLDRATVVHAQPTAEHVVLEGWNGPQRVLGFIPWSVLAGYFGYAGLGGDEANLLADANTAAFTRVMADKLERGEYRPWSRLGVTVPCVDIAGSDIENSVQALNADGLPLWAGQGGIGGVRFHPDKPPHTPERWIEISPRQPAGWSLAVRGPGKKTGAEPSDTPTLGEARRRAKELAATHGIGDVVIRNRK